MSTKCHRWKQEKQKITAQTSSFLENCRIKHNFRSEKADPFIAETSVLIILFRFGKVINPLVEIIMLHSFCNVLLRAHKEICDEMLGRFNEHFIASGSLFEPLNIPHEKYASICSDKASVSHYFSFNSTLEEYKLLVLLEN